MSQVSRGSQERGCPSLDDGGAEEAELILDREGGRGAPTRAQVEEVTPGMEELCKAGCRWVGRKERRALAY